MFLSIQALIRWYFAILTMQLKRNFSRKCNIRPHCITKQLQMKPCQLFFKKNHKTLSY